jgi:myo-inositol-1-phosphate synthase
MNLGEGLRRAGVFEWSLQEQLRPFMSSIVPRKAAFSQDFVAANQADRADNIIQGTKQQQLNQLRCDIQDFKAKKNLDKIIIMWVGNTERFSALHPGLNDTWANLEKSIAAGAHEISPSTLYAVAAALENVRKTAKIQLNF